MSEPAKAIGTSFLKPPKITRSVYLALGRKRLKTFFSWIVSGDEQFGAGIGDQGQRNWPHPAEHPSPLRTHSPPAKMRTTLSAPSPFSRRQASRCSSEIGLKMFRSAAFGTILTGAGPMSAVLAKLAFYATRHR